MGKLDVGIMRHMSKDEFRVLTAVEMGMRNHAAVPVPLIVSIAGLRHGGSHKLLNELLRWKLVYHDRSKYDGYRLTWQGYDFLALNVLLRRGVVDRVGRKIGEGKESDVYEAWRESDGSRLVIKFHRLGKTSFKAVKSKRDYLCNGTKSAGNWLNMSRLAARREWDFLKCLHENCGDCMTVPDPVDQNRHAVVMSLAAGMPLYQLSAQGALGDQTEAVYRRCVDLPRLLAQRGLVHCDLNEFNLIVDHTNGAVTLIDFPQLVSTAHPNALFYFQRDLAGILKFFKHKLKYEADPEPDHLPELILSEEDRLDKKVRASGHDELKNQTAEEKMLQGALSRDKEHDHGDDDDEDEDSDDEEEDDDEEGEEEEGDEEEETVVAEPASLSEVTPVSADFPRSFFDEDRPLDAASERGSEVSTLVDTVKLRREHTKRTAQNSRHNGQGSRNFSKMRIKGKIRHKESMEY